MTISIGIYARPKRKPNYYGTKTMQEFLGEIFNYFGAPMDEREREDGDHVKLRSVADGLFVKMGLVKNPK